MTGCRTNLKCIGPDTRAISCSPTRVHMSSKENAPIDLRPGMSAIRLPKPPCPCATAASQQFPEDAHEQQYTRDRHYHGHDKGRPRAPEYPLLIEYLEGLPIFESAHHHREGSHCGQKESSIAWNVRPDDELPFGILNSLEDLENGEPKAQQRKRCPDPRHQRAVRRHQRIHHRQIQRDIVRRVFSFRFSSHRWHPDMGLPVTTMTLAAEH